MWWLLQLSEGKPNQTISQEKNKIIENKMLWKKIKLKFIDSKNVRPSFKKNYNSLTTTTQPSCNALQMTEELDWQKARLFGFSNSVNCREWNATQCAKITLLILSLFKSVWIILIIMIKAWMVVVISYVDNNTIPNENTPTDTFWFNHTFFCTIQTLSFIFLRTCFECNKVKMAYWQFSSLALHLLHTIYTKHGTRTQAQERLGK